MQDITQTIRDFKENIIFDSIFALFFIIIFAILLCVLFKKSRQADSIIYKAWWIVVLLLGVTCLRLFMLIPAFVDAYMDNIKVVEVTGYRWYGYNASLVSLASGPKIRFTNIEGERRYGRMLTDADFPENGHGCILYAKYSHLILDFDLTE